MKLPCSVHACVHARISMRAYMCMCVHPPSTILNAWTDLYELGMYIMLHEAISVACFLNLSHQ
jgi:hypothetical protein